MGRAVQNYFHKRIKKVCEISMKLFTNLEKRVIIRL